MYPLLKASINIFGKLIYYLPHCILHFWCYLLAILFLVFQKKRRLLLYQNLRGCFPQHKSFELSRIGIISTARTIEQGLLLFAWPNLSSKRLKKMFQLSSDHESKLKAKVQSMNGCLWLIPHFCHADALSILPHYMGENHHVNALYRPLGNPILNNFLRTSRERFGVSTIDRKRGGMLRTLRVLKKGNILAMLFDQNAGGAGTRMQFMGKECSCTGLPDILYEKYKPRILFVYTRRIGFWKSQIQVEEMDHPEKGKLVIEHANKWLEDKLKQDVALCETWLWLHQRWKPLVGKKAQIK